ncbi:protein ecdysoneless homolog [Mya arenaria]|uniref:protein ecdysoneless homolog n=1 Tax=Mya arenaria TaxID=6604 RepID=UPI0022E88708|nr:protein ecdysoneless homolog [Mya arenaria]
MAEKQNKVAEDVVEYFLYPSLSESTDRAECVRELEECLKNYMTSLSTLLIDVIWQKEGFKLKCVQESGNVPGHLHGETSFAENVEDEWFIVYLLYQLTQRFPGLVARVHDSDEEFLLIEAADALPKWLNPDTAENRVYIYNGELHIIPVPQSHTDKTIFPQTVNNIGDAVDCIRKNPTKTRAAPNIQVAINNRINKFPDLLQDHTHYTHCFIPAQMAAILDERPDLLAPAVRAFYYRDPMDLKCCRTFTYFRPGTRITHRTRMTRCLYAQLVHQTFQPDRRSGWVLPATSSPKFLSHDLGMKLAHGFEILCHKAAGNEATTPTNDNIPTKSHRWQQYVQSLQENNYFRGELDGSVLYKKLLDNAWKFYKENMLYSHRSEDPGSQIHQLLKSVPVDVEERRLAEHNLQPPDDDSWLTLTPDSLDAMLRERGGNLDEDGDVFDLGKVADSMKSFVKKISSVEGAEVPGADDEDDDADIQFDGSGFINAMQEMFEFDDDASVSSSDMSEYGWEDDSDNEGRGKTKIKRPPSLDRYMDVMDRELAKTDVGKSFERQSKPQAKKTMKEPSGNNSKPPKDIDEEDDDFQPVDIDLNAVKNLLESYGAQEGLAGPTSNILGSMGLVLPPNLDHTPNGTTPTNENIETISAPSPAEGNKDKPQPPTVPPRVREKGKPAPPPRPVVPPRKGQSSPKSQAAKPPPRVSRSRIDSKETDV